jgi:3-phosphoshikimate 1-carboxyvinyltransferase
MPTMHSLELSPVARASGRVTLPGSKSISNRALLLAAMAAGETRIGNLLDSDDTRYMREALVRLGVALLPEGSDWVVTGKDGPLVTDGRETELYLGMAGTAYRPLTAALCLGNGCFRLDGNARMAERPIAHLVDALRRLGGDITYLGTDGYPPLQVRGTGLRGGTTEIAGNVSSQFLTSLLMALPLANAPVAVRVMGEQVSKPYLDITMKLMARFGAAVDHTAHQHFDVKPGRYHSPGYFLVEGDASSATYFLAAGAIGGPVRVDGVGADSIQGDMAFVDVLRAMGAEVMVAPDHVEVRGGRLRGVDLDLNAIPDAAMTAAVLALFAEGPTRIRNIYNWRVKETDRLSAMAIELRKVGAGVEEGPDYIAIDPPARLRAATIDTYDDHRMAMCFSLIALGGVPVIIRDPDCVSKTFPDYFTVFDSLRAA